MNKPPRVSCPPGAHSAVQRATARLSGIADLPDAEMMVGTTLDLGLEPLPERTFHVFRREGRIWFTGDRARSVLAGVLYWLHHRNRGGEPALPLLRTSPYPNRLILEDFPFKTYAPSGVKFDDELYAENLVALGYTAMECNRLSPRQPVDPWFDNFQTVDPSPSKFIWTAWHEGVFDPAVVAANAAELRKCVDLALRFDLEPSATMFLPRPYSEAFFEKHPHLRGPFYEHEYLGRGGHPDQFSIDTDHPDGLAFYEAIFSTWVRRFPEIRNYFFWHGDLGAQFWKDGEGPKKRRRMDRILEFHHLLDRIFHDGKVDPQVWLSPWAMPEHTLDELNEKLPARVGYSTKDNPAAAHFNGTIRFRMIDSTVTTADIGEIALKVKVLAGKSGRRMCFGQYHDFSEDLDPIVGAPHPLMTYRKMANLRVFSPETSMTEWGILSPDLSACRVTQDVVREMTWGAESTCIEELLPLLLPEALAPAARDKVSAAWRKVDYALQIWPQYWGMRFQGCGVRQRWLVKPLLPVFVKLPDAYFNRLVNRQLYRYNAPNIYREFMNLTPPQVREIAKIYTDMIELMRQADALLDEATAEAGDSREWVGNQIPPARWMRIFWTTFRNQFLFHLDAPDDHLTENQRLLLQGEIENTRGAIALLREHPKSLIIAGRSWPQCFGPDLEEDFQMKLKFMEGL